MIGVFDYTSVLTYLSAVFAGLGILISLSGGGHPYAGCIFLLLCGVCDAFDGRVARSKKGRTEYEIKFGVQIDSLCDIIAFGMLPVAIGGALIRLDPGMNQVLEGASVSFAIALKTYFMYAVMMLYIVFGVARLAHFNVTEEERQSTENGDRRFFQGVPVTTAAIIFPTVIFIQYITGLDMTIAYFVLMLITAIGFVVNVKVPKASKRGIIIMIVLCGIEFAVMLYGILK